MSASKQLDPSELRVVEATEPQRREARRLIYQDYPVWRRHRTIEQYWEADDVISRADLAHRRAWVLVHQDDLETLDVLSVCLTYRHEVVVSPPPRPREDGEGTERTVARGTAYSVGGVFTPQKYRGKGYAGRMMALLHPLIRSFPLVPATPRPGEAHPTEASPLPLVCSVLFSDLFDYYERFGWKNKPFSDTVFHTPDGSKPRIPTGSSGAQEIAWIRDADAEAVFAALAAHDCVKTAEEIRSSVDQSKTLMSLLEPSADSWKHHRLQSLMQARFQGRDVPSNWGVALRGSEIDGNLDVGDGAASAAEVDASAQLAPSYTSWAVWWYDFRPPPATEPGAPISRLIVLRHRAASASALVAVINAARRAAADVGIDTVVFWNMEYNSSPSSSHWAGAEVKHARDSGHLGQVSVEQRPHSRPAVAWYLGETAASPNTSAQMLQLGGDGLDWLNAERTWCLMT
ncbi:unnamed protein product [Parajaminaea phylloscopi]